MSETQSIGNVCDLLDKLSKLDAAKVEKAAKAADEERVKAFEPDRDLLHPREPGFVHDGYVGFDYAGLIDAVRGGENIGISGPTGAGKSALCFHVVDVLNEPTRAKNREIWERNKKAIKGGAKADDLEGYIVLPYQIEHMSCSMETRVAEIIGDVDLVYDEDGRRRSVTRWGHVVEAWTKGRILIAEEVDMPDPGVWAGSHQLFDGRTVETSVFVNGTQTIRKADGFRIMATMNTLLKGENREEYAGTQVQNSAWVNRFGYLVVLGYMDAAHEAKMLAAKTGIDNGLAYKLAAIADKSRRAYAEHAVDSPITTRDLLAWSREILRTQKRLGFKPGTQDHWNKAAVPAAGPAFINRQPDEATKTAYTTYLSLR